MDLSTLIISSHLFNYIFKSIFFRIVEIQQTFIFLLLIIIIYSLLTKMQQKTALASAEAV